MVPMADDVATKPMRWRQGTKPARGRIVNHSLVLSGHKNHSITPILLPSYQSSLDPAPSATCPTHGLYLMMKVDALAAVTTTEFFLGLCPFVRPLRVVAPFGFIPRARIASHLGRWTMMPRMIQSHVKLVTLN